MGLISRVSSRTYRHLPSPEKKMGSDSEYGPRLYRYNARRYAFGPLTAQGQPSVTGAGLFYEDTMGLVMNLMTMVFSMGAMLMRVKWCGWAGIICAMISYTSARSIDDARQVLSSALLGLSAIIMSYMATPGPLSDLLFPRTAALGQ